MDEFERIEGVGREAASEIEPASWLVWQNGLWFQYGKNSRSVYRGFPVYAHLRPYTGKIQRFTTVYSIFSLCFHFRKKMDPREKKEDLVIYLTKKI
jgi:hypothetical protein